MALNTLLIYLSLCFVIIVSEEMTQKYGGRGDQGGISKMSGPDKDGGLPKQREEYVLDDKTKWKNKENNEKFGETCRLIYSG
jgi:hypothetical protein